MDEFALVAFVVLGLSMGLLCGYNYDKLAWICLLFFSIDSFALTLLAWDWPGYEAVQTVIYIFSRTLLLDRFGALIAYVLFFAAVGCAGTIGLIVSGPIWRQIPTSEYVK